MREIPGKLIALFDQCKDEEEVSLVYQKTKHISGAFQQVKKRIFEMMQNPVPKSSIDENIYLSSWYSLQSIRAVYSKEFSIWGGDLQSSDQTCPHPWNQSRSFIFDGVVYASFRKAYGACKK